MLRPPNSTAENLAGVKQRPLHHHSWHNREAQPGGSSPEEQANAASWPTILPSGPEALGYHEQGPLVVREACGLVPRAVCCPRAVCVSSHPRPVWPPKPYLRADHPLGPDRHATNRQQQHRVEPPQAPAPQRSRSTSFRSGFQALWCGSVQRWLRGRGLLSLPPVTRPGAPRRVPASSSGLAGMVTGGWQLWPQLRPSPARTPHPRGG